MKYFVLKIIILSLFISFASTTLASDIIGTINAGFKVTKICQDAACTGFGNINWKPTINGMTPGALPVTITDTSITGHVWGDQIGWVNLAPTGAGVFVNSSTGVVTGRAFATVGSWINFNPTGQGVTLVDNGSGSNFFGWAWVSGAHGGWMKFDCADVGLCIKTDWRTIPNRVVDTDIDGNSDAVENAGFNSGDGNGDGILDSGQQSVSSTPNPVSSGSTTLEAVGGCNIINGFTVSTESANAAQDANFSYPAGMNNFMLTCGTAGDVATVTIFFDRVYDTSQWRWRKYDATTGTYNDVTGLVTVTIGSQTVGGTPVTRVTYVVTDGGSLDTDHVLNSHITDPVGPAIPVIISSSGGGSGDGYVPLSTLKTGTTRDINGACTPYLPINEYISLVDKDNKPAYVKLVQQFLNSREGEKLVVDGVYKEVDVLAIKKFQIKYASQVLRPQKLKKPTGVVSLFTIAKINAIECGYNTTLPTKKTPSVPQQCPYFTTKMKQGDIHKEVTKIQSFLNTTMDARLKVSGTFDSTTKQAVKNFQVAYKTNVLLSIGLKLPTGLWYTQTIKKANELIGCK